jgi:hypothetical protein
VFDIELEEANGKKAFRNEDGTSTEGNLVLLLKDFDVPVGIPAAHQNRRIEISYQTLTEYLGEAEAGYQAMDGNGGLLQMPVGTKKRKRERTPPSSLSDGREASNECPHIFHV